MSKHSNYGYKVYQNRVEQKDLGNGFTVDQPVLEIQRCQLFCCAESNHYLLVTKRKQAAIEFVNAYTKMFIRKETGKTSDFDVLYTPNYIFRRTQTFSPYWKIEKRKCTEKEENLVEIMHRKNDEIEDLKGELDCVMTDKLKLQQMLVDFKRKIECPDEFHYWEMIETIYGTKNGCENSKVDEQLIEKVKETAKEAVRTRTFNAGRGR